VLGSYALRAARDHPSLAIAVSSAAPLAVSRVAFIPRQALHPNAARSFVDYLLSQDGQQHLGNAGLFPIRRQPGNKAETVTHIPIDRNFEDLLDRERRRRLLDRWNAAIAANHRT
jgi:iron(III) transport system substrate-binding protein